MPEKNKLSLSVQYPDLRLKTLLTRPLLRRWVKAALQGPAELTLRFVDQAEGQSLNRDYRGKDYATNVLTFCYDDAFEDNGFDDAAEAGGAGKADETEAEPGDEGIIRADIILCTDVLQSEASAQGKTLEAHSAHLIVHGVLHAQGYDHEDELEADAMEQLETAILARLGVANPYADRD